MESATKGQSGKGKGGVAAEWTPDDLALLIKAVNLFPAGTNQRWEVVAQFINQHTTSGAEKTSKEVLSKTKGLQSSDYSSIKDAANKKAYQDFEKNQKNPTAAVSDDHASQRFDSNSLRFDVNYLLTNFSFPLKLLLTSKASRLGLRRNKNYWNRH